MTGYIRKDVYSVNFATVDIAYESLVCSMYATLMFTDLTPSIQDTRNS
jgi:hypothetical protein